MHFQAQCPNLKFVITKNISLLEQTCLEPFPPRKKVSVSDLQTIMGIEDL